MKRIPITFPMILVCQLVLLIAPRPAGACGDGSCTLQVGCNDQAQPVPSELWGSLRPLDVAPLPSSRNSSSWDFLLPRPPYFLDLATLDESVVVAVGTGFQTWRYDDALGTFERSSHLAFDAASGLVGTHQIPPELSHPFATIAAHAGRRLVAVGGSSPGGVVFVDLAVAAAPQPLAQLSGIEAIDVAYAERGEDSFLLATGTGPGLPSMGGMLRLELPSGPLPAPCITTLAAAGCDLEPQLVPGSAGMVWLAVDGDLVIGAGPSLGVRGWHVDAAGQLERGLELDLVVAGQVLDVALWRHGGTVTLATLASRPAGPTLELRDVSCLGRGGCAEAPPIFAAQLMPRARRLTLSRRDGRPHLAVTSATYCGSSLQEEWVLDVSDPLHPVDLTPPAALVEGELTGYWGWYYTMNPTGTHRVAPTAGVWSHGAYVRAARSLLDVHLPSDPLLADFDVDSLEIYPGDAIALTSTSGGGPATLEWDYGDDGTVDATGPTAVLTTASVGPVPVRLTVSDGAGTASRVRVVEVLDPCPRLDGIAAPSTVDLCGTVDLDARGLAGQGPSTLGWEIEHPELGVIASATNVDPFPWSPGPGLLGASPQVAARATALAAACSPSTTSRNLSLTLPAAPQAPTSIVSTPIGPGLVRLSALGAVGLEWRWDFDDDVDPATRLWTDWASLPSNRSIVHQYLDTNPHQDGIPRQLRVQLRTCIAGPVEAGPHALYVESVEPVEILSFRVACPDPVCHVAAGIPVPFEVVVQGPVEVFHFDWLGDMTSIESRPDAPATHVYCDEMAVLIRPFLELTGWGVSDFAESTNQLLVGPGPGCTPPLQPLFVDGFDAGDLSGWQ